MQYSKLFGRLNKEGELRNLDNDQLARLMNIVSLEGTIHGVKKFPQDSRPYNLTVFSYETELTKLTGNLKPLDLYKEMVRLTRETLG